MSDVNSLVGKTETDANTEATTLGYKVRVMGRDGKSFFGTCDFRTDRVNFEVNDGVIAKAWIG